MTCSCNASLIRSWTDPTDGTINVGFTLRDQQYYARSGEMRVKGRCRGCGLYHSIPSPDIHLRAFFVIPVVKQESIAITVKVRHHGN